MWVGWRWGRAKPSTHPPSPSLCWWYKPATNLPVLLILPHHPQDPDADIRQSGFALVGDLAKACAPHIKPALVSWGAVFGFGRVAFGWAAAPHSKPALVSWAGWAEQVGVGVGVWVCVWWGGLRRWPSAPCAT